MGVTVYKIRFPLMSSREFGIVKDSGLLRPGEITDLEANFRKNKTYCHIPRSNVCRCLRDKIPCFLCTGLRIHSVNGILQLFPRLDENNNEASEHVDKCECLRYMSCPNHPNGKTYWVMESALPQKYFDESTMKSAFEFDNLRVKLT